VDEAELVRWYGRWQPWTVKQVAGLLEDWPHPWWIAGGYALDAFTGLTRSHDDIDVAIFRRDIPALRAHLGASYHCWAAGSGALRPLTAEEPQLPGWADQCWVREHAGTPWRADILANPDRDGAWVFRRRDPTIVLPLDAVVSKQTISAITDRVMEGMAAWQNRPLDPVYPVIFIDCVNVKIRDGNVANRPIYVALAVTCEGTRDILGLWAGEHGDGEGAKYWMRVLSEIKKRGTRDCLIVVCDGLKGLPEAVTTVWPQTIVQTCIVHLLRNSFKYASKKDWAAIAKDLKPVYTAVSESAALNAFAEFSEKWEKKYPAIIRLWTNAWAEFVPFLQFDQEIRTIICTTNAIESINARIRRAVNARGHFPTEAAALKCVYLAIMSLDPTGKGQQRWSNRWKAALNAFEITFDGRLSA
jgi:transposase-like protein